MEFFHNTLYHSFYRVQLPTQHRIGLVDHFVQTSAVLSAVILPLQTTGYRSIL